MPISQNECYHRICIVLHGRQIKIYIRSLVHSKSHSCPNWLRILLWSKNVDCCILKLVPNSYLQTTIANKLMLKTSHEHVASSLIGHRPRHVTTCDSTQAIIVSMIWMQKSITNSAVTWQARATLNGAKSGSSSSCSCCCFCCCCQFTRH